MQRKGGNQKLAEMKRNVKRWEASASLRLVVSFSSYPKIFIQYTNTVRNEKISVKGRNEEELYPFFVHSFCLNVLRMTTI